MDSETTSMECEATTVFHFPIPDPTYKQVEFFNQLQRIVSELPKESYFLRWLRSDNRPDLYCHIVIQKEEFRREILCLIEEHYSTGNYPAIDGYVVGKKSIAIAPVIEDGTEVSQPPVPFGI